MPPLSLRDRLSIPLVSRYGDAKSDLHDRSLGGVSLTPQSDSGPDTDPRSSAVLIPLIISMILIVLGIGTAMGFYITYRRRNRLWLAEFGARREAERMRAEEEEKKGGEGPGWWEVEVGDEEDRDWEEEEGEKEKEGEMEQENEKRWNPVAVTYHHDPPSTLSTPTPDLKSNSTHVTATSTSSPTSAPRSVEMTVLIAMPSPSPTRSRRSSPASSSPSLDLSGGKDGMIETRVEDVWEDEIPEVQLATVLLPVRREEI